jgi:chorismate-pyruvate lyase
MRSDLSLFERILLATDGTVTDLVALFAGEPIRVRKLEQAVVEGSSAELNCPSPAPMLDRRILLSGATRNFLYAESRFVLDRLPESIRESLLHTDRPIGLLWKEARLETFREVVRRWTGPRPEIARHFGVPSDTEFVSRTYLIQHAGKPLGMITEAWPLHSFG